MKQGIQAVRGMLLVLLALACGTSALASASASTSTSASVGWQGEAPARGLGGPLDLTAHTGKPFTLAQVKGSPTLLFFGFTQCGDTCPVAMLQAQQVLGAFRAGRPPKVVFVTLDPLSDPPDVLAAYLAKFDSRIIGLTGSPVAIEAAARRYGVGTQGSSTPVAHSTRWYLLDENAQLVRVYKLDTRPSVMVQDIIRMRAQGIASVWSKGAP